MRQFTGGLGYKTYRMCTPRGHAQRLRDSPAMYGKHSCGIGMDFAVNMSDAYNYGNWPDAVPVAIQAEGAYTWLRSILTALVQQSLTRFVLAHSQWQTCAHSLLNANALTVW